MGIYCKSVAIILILFLYVFIGENGNLGHKSQQWLYDFVLLGGLLPLATDKSRGLMDINGYRGSNSFILPSTIKSNDFIKLFSLSKFGVCVFNIQ